MRLYLVRHGETDWNVEGRMQGLSDTVLNANGLEQAQCLAERLAEEPELHVIYSSPLRRALKTAEVIGERLGLPVLADQRLIEHHIGQLEGLTLAEIKDKFPEVYRVWTQGGTRQPFPGEEPRNEFQARIRSLIRDIQARHSDQNVLLVTHGGAMGMLLATLLELDLTRRFPFSIDNASLSIVEMGITPRIRLLNDTCHFSRRDVKKSDGEQPKSGMLRNESNGHSHSEDAAQFAAEQKSTVTESA